MSPVFIGRVCYRWCGVPISIVKDMKIYNDGRIIWLTKHCSKDYAIAFHVAKPEEAADLPDMLKEAFGLIRPDHGRYRPFEGNLERIGNAERLL